MNVLDLFSGIGGFSLGLERAGMTTVAFCEIDPFCRRVLAKHWPEVPIYDDVRTLSADRLRADGIAVDVICGGFPCQDISVAGKGAGLAGERSGLWREYARIVGELRPRYVVVENVSALLGRGLGDVLGDLAALGYDAEWHCIPAFAVGAPHQRDRIWIVAYTDCESVRNNRHSRVAGAASSGQGATEKREWVWADVVASGCGGDVADANRAGREELDVAAVPEVTRQLARSLAAGRSYWGAEPGMGRVAHGVPRRVDRLRALGNAVVPQIPEMIGRAIMAHAV
jgi:DNA (cytosine-5)-methyltransferase 1